MYERDPNMAPDSDFEPGSLELLRAGNTGRMLDPRRTPITIVDVRGDVGMFELEVTAFEDEGARWVLPFEDVAKFQFAHGSTRAAETEMSEYAAAVAEFDRALHVGPGPDAGDTPQRVAEVARKAERWLGKHSEFLGSGRPMPAGERRGDAALFADLDRWLDEEGVADLERVVAETYVSNPHSGEVLKGHRIVIAELGLVRYDGKVVRDPATLSGQWSKERRVAHVVARLGFVRAVFAASGLDRVVLYRSLSYEGAPRERNDGTFVSATFNRDIAESWLDTDGLHHSVVMMRQPVSVDRLFMTYLETEAMNRQFLESEAVLLADATNPLF